MSTTTKLLPENKKAEIIKWAQHNASTETYSFDETRYCGIVDGAIHEATRSLKLVEALSTLRHGLFKDADAVNELIDKTLQEYNSIP